MLGYGDRQAMEMRVFTHPFCYSYRMLHELYNLHGVSTSDVKTLHEYSRRDEETYVLRILLHSGNSGSPSHAQWLYYASNY